MKVNYINQLNGFLDLLYIKPLSTSAICLYVILFHLNNKCGWLKEFTVANLTIQGLAGMSRNQLHKARLELIQKGYIDYKKGSGNQCGTYLLVRFDTQMDTQMDTQTDTQMDTQMDTQKQHSLGTLNKLNKTKLEIKEKNIKKEKYGSLENVALTAEEFEKLKAEYPDYEERIERLSLYIGSKGDKYKSHYATIKNWARKDGVTTKPKPKDVFALE